MYYNIICVFQVQIQNNNDNPKKKNDKSKTMINPKPMQ